MHKMGDEELDKKFYEELLLEDELGVVIRAHLHVEHWVNELIELLVPKPEHIKPMELDYFGKINLICAVGLKDDYKKPLKFMGTTRNNFAHQMGRNIDKGTVNNFYEQFSEEGKKIAHRVFESSITEGENKKYANFRHMPPKDQFIFMAISVRNMVKRKRERNFNSRNVNIPNWIGNILKRFSNLVEIKTKIKQVIVVLNLYRLRFSLASK